MGYGFVIDQSRCIGCHACTVACKAENEVPLGSFRTWVKYVEKGAFPAVRRHFTVLRCNHCDAAPCVEICPVNALHKRPDAIVDLDRDLCIGCRACMQACPYDALYFHEDKGVAEKCHYCAHRTEVGLEPACVIVCPVEAIISGDADDPGSRIGKIVSEEPVARRKLEKGTRPRVWYVDALPEALAPGVAAEPAMYLWSDRAPDDPATAPPSSAAGAPAAAAPDATVTLDVRHPSVWGWHVWAYLTTKNIAAGAAIMAPFLGLLGVADGVARALVPELVSLLFLGVTCGLLVHDLGRPERFLKMLTNPNPRSWLVRGTWILMAFGFLVTASLFLGLLGLRLPQLLARLVTLPAAVLCSGYSAWLFGQCRGRELWTEPGLFTSLVLRATLAGAGLAILLPQDEGRVVPTLAFAALCAATAVLLFHEARLAGSGPESRLAHDLLRAGTRGLPPLVTGAAAAGSMLLLPTAPGGFLARALLVGVSLVGVLIHEKAWVEAGQGAPIS